MKDSQKRAGQSHRGESKKSTREGWVRKKWVRVEGRNKEGEKWNHQQSKWYYLHATLSFLTNELALCSGRITVQFEAMPGKSECNKEGVQMRVLGGIWMGIKERREGVILVIKRGSVKLFDCKFSASCLHGNLRDFVSWNIFLNSLSKQITKIDFSKSDGWIKETWGWHFICQWLKGHLLHSTLCQEVCVDFRSHTWRPELFCIKHLKRIIFFKIIYWHIRKVQFFMNMTPGLVLTQLLI